MNISHRRRIELLPEEWKDIPTHPKWQASSLGRIRRTKILKIRKGKLGYSKINLGNCRGLSVHRLVALSFIEKQKGANQVNHIDGNKSNSVISNLEWTTCADNHRHAYATGLRENRRSDDSPLCVYSDATIADIRAQDFTKRGSMSRYAEKCGLPLPYISQVYNYKYRTKGR